MTLTLAKHTAHDVNGRRTQPTLVTICANIAKTLIIIVFTTSGGDGKLYLYKTLCNHICDEIKLNESCLKLLRVFY